jgi:LPS export ABC transporter permease LptG/LPS export ABC transporter permease LptF
MRIIDRYVIREVVPPFLLGLLVFTFVLIIPFIIDIAEQMIAKNVPAITILRLAATLLPSSMALTVPMALLIGLLVGLGRLSADREVVVMMACGISPYRMLQPVLVFSVVCWGLTSWLMLKGMPDGNQRYREITQEIVMERAEGEVRPRVFFDDFPNLVLYVHEVPLDGKGWVDVMAADTSNASQPIIYLAKRGRMVIDRKAQTIHMVLEQGARHTTKLDDPAAYEVLNFESTIIALDPSSVFPRTGPARGEREMPIEDLAARAAEMRANGQSPHNPVMEIHKKFSVPIACIVFALLGLALGASHRKDGKLAAFVLGIGVIFAYYVLMFTAEALAKGFWLPAWSAMWVPDIVLGAAGLFLLRRRARSADRPIRISMPAWLRRWTGGDAAGSGTAASSTAPSRRATSRPVVVIRVPHFDLPRPTLLDGYVARQYGRILAMTITGLLGLFYISTFIDKSDKLFKGQITVFTLLEFLLWSTPEFLTYIIAIGVLLAGLVTIGLLTKNSELIVMRACGISLYRTAMPMIAFAIAAGAVLLALQENVLTIANRRAEELDQLIRYGKEQSLGVLNRKWIVGRNGEVYHYQYYDPNKLEMHNLSVFEFDRRDHRLTSRRFVQKARYTADARPDADPQWLLDQGWLREFSAAEHEVKFTRFTDQVQRFEPAEYFVTEAREPDLMNFQQLRVYIAELRASGYNVLEHEVGLHRKIAFPFVTLVMTLIAVPFAVTTGRRGAMYGIGIGIVLALIYWVMISIFGALGASGVLNPMLAAWAPNLIFGAVAAYLLLTVRT